MENFQEVTMWYKLEYEYNKDADDFEGFLHSGKSKFVFSGGVMCNSIIKKALSLRYESYFASLETSSDSAVGIAALARRKYIETDL